MVQTKESLLEQLEAFSQENKKLLVRGKELMKQLESKDAASCVNQPFLLQMILDKYLEIIEDKLLPCLPDAEDSNNRQADSQASRDNTDPSHRVCTPHTVDDFRNTNPTIKTKNTVSRLSKVATKRATHKVPIRAPRPTSAHLVDDFRGTDPRYHAAPVEAKPAAPPRPMSAQAATPGPAAQAKPVTPATATPTPEKPIPTTAHLSEKSAENTGRHGHRRTIPRYNCRMPLSYCILGKSKQTFRAYSKDVGAMGLFILANRPEKAGETIEIEVEMPDKDKARIQAVVAWTKWVPPNLRTVDMPGFGVRITNATENWYSYFMNASQPGHLHL